MNAQERAAIFLNRLVRQPAVTLKVKSQENPRFVKAAKIMLPALLAVAAAYAAVPTPKPLVQVNGAHAMAVPTIQQRIAAAVQRRDTQFSAITSCLAQTQGAASPSGPAAQFDAALATMSNAAKVDAEITQWAQDTGGSAKLAVAAYCQSPANWRAQLQAWQDKREAVVARMAARGRGDMAPAIDQVFDRMAHMALSDAMARGQTVRQTAMVLIDRDRLAPMPGEFQGAHAIQVNGFDWASAAVSLVSGAAEMFGGSNTQRGRIASNTGSIIQDGSGWARDAQSIAQSSTGYSKMSQIGNMIGSVGRTVSRYRSQQPVAPARQTYSTF